VARERETTKRTMTSEEGTEEEDQPKEVDWDSTTKPS